jgi:hypothetical protein
VRVAGDSRPVTASAPSVDSGGNLETKLTSLIAKSTCSTWNIFTVGNADIDFELAKTAMFYVEQLPLKSSLFELLLHVWRVFHVEHFSLKHYKYGLSCDIYRFNGISSRFPRSKILLVLSGSGCGTFHWKLLD